MDLLDRVPIQLVNDELKQDQSAKVRLTVQNCANLPYVQQLSAMICSGITRNEPLALLSLPVMSSGNPSECKLKPNAGHLAKQCAPINRHLNPLAPREHEKYCYILARGRFAVRTGLRMSCHAGPSSVSFNFDL